MYSTQAKVEAYLNRELTESEAESIDDVIIYISSFIESFTHRQWLPVLDGEREELDQYTALEAEAHVFSGNGQREIFIEDFTNLESVSLLDSQGNSYLTLTQAIEFILNPRNKPVKSSIYLRNYRFPQGESNIEIIAVWGAGNCPSAVEVACTTLVAKYLQKKSTSGAGFKSESIEGYSYTLQTTAEIDSEVQGILETLGMYKRIIL